MTLFNRQLRTLILSRKAAAIAEQLPNTSVNGLICYYDDNDIQAAKAAAKLAGDPKAIIIGQFRLGLLVGLMAGVLVASAYWFGYAIGFDAGYKANPTTERVRE